MKFKNVKDTLYTKDNKKISINKLVIDNINDFIVDRFIFVEDVNKASRILQYQDTGYMIISAFKKDESDINNLKATKNLENDLVNLCLGFRPSIGGYVYEDGTKGKELSYVVPKTSEMSDEEFLKLALELCKKYGQESVLVCLPSVNNSNPVYLKPDNNIDMEFKKLTFTNEEDPDYYTELRKKGTPKFILEDKSPIIKKDFSGNEYVFIPSNITTKQISDSFEQSYLLLCTMYDTKDLKNYNHGEFLPGFKGRFLKYHG